MTMSCVEKGLQSLETLYLALESHLEAQYQDLLAQRLPDSPGKAEAADLERRLLEAETLLSGSSSHDGMNPVAPDVERVWKTAGVTGLTARVQHLLELVKRNAAQCAQLQSLARKSLQELQRGERYLQSMRGYRENQPRFFDSCQ